MQKYRTLEKELHLGDHASADTLHHRRFTSESALSWNFQLGEHPLFLLFTPDIADRIEAAYQAELTIQHQWGQLPGGDRQHYLQGLLLDEVVSTNRIEGVLSTRREIREALDSRRANHRFREFTRLYLTLAQEKPRSPGPFRKSGISTTRSWTGKNCPPQTSWTAISSGLGRCTSGMKDAKNRPLRLPPRKPDRRRVIGIPACDHG